MSMWLEFCGYERTMIWLGIGHEEIEAGFQKFFSLSPRSSYLPLSHSCVIVSNVSSSASRPLADVCSDVYVCVQF